MKNEPNEYFFYIVIKFFKRQTIRQNSYNNNAMKVKTHLNILKILYAIIFSYTVWCDVKDCFLNEY